MAQAWRGSLSWSQHLPQERQTDRRGPRASPEPEADQRDEWPGRGGSTEPAANVHPRTGPQEVTSPPS